MADNSNTRANSTKMVTVGCKLPHGIYAELMPSPREAPDGQVRSPLPAGPRIVLKGANSVRNDYTIRGLSQPQFDFGVTAVPEDFWERWSKQEIAQQFIAKGLIFVVDRERDFKAQAREKLPEKTGLEPLKPDIEHEPRVKTGSRPEERVMVDQEHLRKLQDANGRD